MDNEKTEILFNDSVFDSYTELVYSIARDTDVEFVMVGGAPRDLLIHHKPRDLDFLIIKGDAQKIPMHLHKLHGFFHPVLFEKFNTYRTGIHGEHDIEMEFIPIRAKTIKGDLLLRDFTINTLTMRRIAMFKYEISDLLGKAFDALKCEIIQTPIEPEKTINDDPLRIMRAIRFSCTLGLNIEKGLIDSLKTLASMLDKVAAERIRDELFFILLADSPSEGLMLMQKLGVIDVIMPEISPMVGFDQHSPYHKDELFTHSLTVMDKTQASLETRLAALFHDTGKPLSVQSSPEKTTYYGHQDKSAELFRAFANRLKLPHFLINRTETLIKRHMINYTSEWKDSTVRKFIKLNYDVLDQLLDLYRADAGALADPVHTLAGVNELTERIEQQELEQIKSLKSPLNGNEIQKLLDIPAGPKIGEIKNAVVDAILEGQIEATKQSAEAFIKKRYSALKDNADKTE